MRKVRRFARRRRHDAAYVLALGARALARHLPRELGLAFFGRLGELVYAPPSAGKVHTARNLSSIYGREWSPGQIAHTARAVYRHLAMNLFDAVHLNRLSDTTFGKIMSAENPEGLAAFNRAYSEGRGVVALTGHIGCFEMLLPLVAQRWGLPAFAVGQRLFDPRIDRMVAQARSGENMDYIRRTDNPRAIVRLLKAGRAFGVLIDQDTDVEGVFARFLGKPAYTPSGPIKLAMKYDIPTFVITTARQSDNTHRVFVSDRLDLKRSDNVERDLVENVQKANDLLGATINRFPEQWVWMHRRWRKKPGDPRYQNVPGAVNARVTTQTRQCKQ